MYSVYIEDINSETKALAEQLVEIIDDLLNHEITFDEGNKLESALKHNYRSFSKFYNAYDTGNIRSINAIMLADNLHTLITDDVLKVINDSPRWRYKNITFSTKKVTE